MKKDKPAGKKRYERPQIVRHHSGFMNKFGRGSFQTPLREIDGVPVKKLVAEYGSPLFVISESALLKKFRETKRAFGPRYPKTTFAWSYKTNYLRAVCSVLHREGAWAEVVSPLEYEMARRLGVPGDKILFNGPAKTAESLSRAARDGARVHVDHFDELRLLEKAAAGLGRKLPVGIRVNLDAGIYPAWDRFGFNLESGQALEAARRVDASRTLTLAGLHCHLGTYILDASAYRRAMVKLLDFTALLESESGGGLSWLDMGGGFASRNTLHASYLPGENLIPSLHDYAAAVTEPLLERYGSREGAPTLFLESGRAIVDECATLLTSVLAAKRLASGKRALVVDAGVNALFTAFWYKHELALTEDYTSFMEDTAVYGPLCMAIDIVRESVMLPPLTPGQILAVRNVGAYNMSQWLQFIHARPAVAMISEAGKPELVRERETLESMIGPERLPERLRGAGKNIGG